MKHFKSKITCSGVTFPLSMILLYPSLSKALLQVSILNHSFWIPFICFLIIMCVIYFVCLGVSIILVNIYYSNMYQSEIKEFVTKRNYFIKGDIVIDKNRNKFIYVQSNGYDKAEVLTTKDNVILTIDLPLFFHPQFDPGYIYKHFN